MPEKKFYLIPSSLGEDNPERQTVPFNTSILEQIEILWVENPKPARAFLKSCKLSRPIQSFDLRNIPPTDELQTDFREITHALKNTTSAGFMSDAGLPCIADPGAMLVTIARKEGFEIVPLVGASSIMLGLMASGMNGQQFVFHGYLPVQPNELRKAIKNMETEIHKTGYTHLFIETPYRNDKLFLFLLQNLSPHIRLSIASNLLQNDQKTDTKTVKEWLVSPPVLGKKPAVFLLGR